MDYCGPIGLPHSKFLTWHEDDQDKALAWTLAQRAKCQSCGTVPEDWLDEDGEDREPPPYVAKTRICLGCVQLDEKSQEIPDDKKPHFQVYLQPNLGEPDGPVRQDRTPG